MAHPAGCPSTGTLTPRGTAFNLGSHLARRPGGGPGPPRRRGRTAGPGRFPGWRLGGLGGLVGSAPGSALHRSHLAGRPPGALLAGGQPPHRPHLLPRRVRRRWTGARPGGLPPAAGDRRGRLGGQWRRSLPRADARSIPPPDAAVPPACLDHRLCALEPDGSVRGRARHAAGDLRGAGVGDGGAGSSEPCGARRDGRRLPPVVRARHRGAGGHRGALRAPLRVGERSQPGSLHLGGCPPPRGRGDPQRRARHRRHHLLDHVRACTPMSA